MSRLNKLVNEKELIELHSKGSSMSTIANHFNVTKASISYWYVKLNLKPVGKPGKPKIKIEDVDISKITRVCWICKKEKPLIEFAKSKSKCLGFDYQCDYCKLISSGIRSKQTRQEAKRIVIEHYTNGINRCQNPKCAVIGGMSDIRTLTVDHIEGNGAKHRKEILKGTSNKMFYLWLIENNFPEGFRIFCMNCQWIKRYENNEFGGHKKKYQSNK